MTTCGAVISLQCPAKVERVRGFQPPWYTVYVYACPECGTTHRMRAGAFSGSSPVRGIGGIVCGAILERVAS